MALLSWSAPAAVQLGRQRQAVRFVLVISALCAIIAPAYGQTAPSAEYQVKAVFLFNLAQFVDWPASALPDPEASVTIGVLGDDPFGSYLDETLRGEKVRGRPLALQRYRRASEVKMCHILFVSRSETDRLEQVFSAVRGRNTLTVGDTDDFIARGGMIRLVTERNKIRIRINLEAVRTAGLTISSKLLRLAQPES